MRFETSRRMIVLLSVGTFLCAALLLSAHVYARELFVFRDTAASPLGIDADTVSSVSNAVSAIATFESVIQGLSDQQRSDPYILDELARLAEWLIRQSSSVNITPERPLTIGLVRQQALEVLPTARTMELLAEVHNINFLRELRTGASFYFEGDASAVFDGGMSAVGMEQITLKTDFAYLTIDVVDTTDPVELALSISMDALPLSDGALALVVRYWSIGASAFLIVAWLVIMLVAKKKIQWWLPAVLCVAIVTVNLSISGLPSPAVITQPADGSKLFVSMYGVESAVLSILTDEPRPNELVMFQELNRPMASKHNSVTHTIDARIYEGGVFSLSISPVHFLDILDKSEEMQLAIHMLTARGLMAAQSDTSFLPDREITRAEFLAVILNLLNLVDEDAVNPFPDVMHGDWFYSVAASAYSEGIIIGFEDGTFRGNSTMSKEEMVVIAANTLISAMGYKTVMNVTVLAERFRDAEQIPWQVEGNVALAATANIIPLRYDGMFAPGSAMTRGDAAVMLFRLFMRLW